MRLETIEFRGYKRLLDARSNVSGRTVAFVGPNEAGKSSVLQALEWSTDDNAGALPVRAQHRGDKRPSPDTHVVTSIYRLEEADLDALSALDIDPEPEITAQSVGMLHSWRRADGTRGTHLTTTIQRSRAPFDAAEQAVGKAVQEIERLGQIGDDRLESFLSAQVSLNRAESTLNTSSEEWTGYMFTVLADTVTELRDLCAQIDFVADLPPEVDSARLALKLATDRLQGVLDASNKPDPESEILRVLAEKIPRFILFADSDRDLAESYDLSNETVRTEPPAPLKNVLRVAGTEVDEVWEAIAGDDPATLRTLEKRVNRHLQLRLTPHWSQSELAVELRFNKGGVVEVNVNEYDRSDGEITPISERSDGLRTFLGLVCFLVAGDYEVPPVLMIDEAERNLHYDAQADLVRVLTHDLTVNKVLYTMHSPGCLPLDLGTGIRVVHRDTENGTSTLRNTFWTDAEPGFSRLLFVMGAQAAAFSEFRRAVLTEGVSDMILLPTLLRNANDGSPLTFQVAFGLSNMTVPDAIGTVALRTAFLVDGDDSGATMRSKLRKEGVPDTHILQLPPGKAIEDLVDRDTYLKTVNEFLSDMGLDRTIDPNALDCGETVAKAIDLYAKQYLDMPNGVGHKIIASKLAELGDDLKLAPGAAEHLTNLLARLNAALDQDYKLTPGQRPATEDGSG